MVDPQIDPDRIPRSLNVLRFHSAAKITKKGIPDGLESAKDYLMSKTYRLHFLGANNYYDMLLSM